MRVRIVTPAPAGSRSGNRVSALRWARLLRELGHRVDVDDDYDGGTADVLVALHAKKSAASVARFSSMHPQAPVVVVLTGTDVYRDLPSSRAVERTLALARRIVALQPLALARLSASERDKARAIFQSAQPLVRPPAPRKRSFDVCVVGHLRAVKDPFLAARAARRLEDGSRLCVLQAGAALTPAMRARASSEMRNNVRYRWLGELPPHRARRLIARSRAMVLSSRMEGGANVVAEAVALSTPILATRIDGTVGQLGERYPGYFEVGDAEGLARLLARIEREPRFVAALSRAGARLATRFSPAAERAALARLFAELG